MEQTNKQPAGTLSAFAPVMVASFNSAEYP